MMDLRDAGPGSVPLEMLRRYLVATGWHARNPSKLDARQPDSTTGKALLEGRSSGRRNFQVYEAEAEDLQGIELIIPTTTESPEYAFQVARIINALSNLEERPEEEIARSIKEVAFDVVRSRIPDAQVINESIHLEVARNFVVGIRSVLAAAATTELNPKPYFLRLKKEAAEYADHCRFAHTFRGSFGFTVESPLNVDKKQALLPGIQPPPPFERRVMRRLTHGLRSVSDAVRTDSTEPIVSDIQSGFSANICENLASLVEETSSSGIIFDFSFSPEWKGERTSPADKEMFLIARPHVEVIRAAAKELRAKIQSSHETVFGRVIRLASDADPSDLTDIMGEREVAILWSSELLGDITVRTSLSPPEYLQAVEAHAAGRPVEVSGTLEKRARRWVLLNATGFTLTAKGG